MEIGKPSSTGGQDLARLYGQKTDPEQVGEAKTERGERQTGQAGSSGTGLAATVEISPEALERAARQEALQLAKELYNNLPDSRQDVIARVKQRMSEGWYDSQNVRETLTDRLVTLLRSMDTS